VEEMGEAGAGVVFCHGAALLYLNTAAILSTEDGEINIKMGNSRFTEGKGIAIMNLSIGERGPWV
jgi:hypothetical protein